MGECKHTWGERYNAKWHTWGEREHTSGVRYNAKWHAWGVRWHTWGERYSVKCSLRECVFVLVFTEYINYFI